MKNQLWIAFTPLYNYIIPAIKAFIRYLTAAVAGINQFISSISGKSLASMKENAKQLKNQVKGYNDLEAAATGAANAHKELASFDDVQIVSSGSGAGGASLGADAQNAEMTIEGVLNNIMLKAAGLMLAIGLLLLVFGHVVLGIGAIAIGIAIFVKEATENPEATLDTITDFFSSTEGVILGVALVVIGILLCCFGHVVLGVGAIIGGAAALVTEAVLNWDEVSATLIDFFSDTGGLIVGVALVVIGILLCFVPGMQGWGIGAIVAGAAALTAEVVLNWDTIKNKVSKFLDDNKELIVGIGTALVVLGIILCFVPGALPLAIGLLVAGGGALAAEVALNWGFIKTKISDFLDKNKALIVGVGIALAILGIVLIATGVGIPLGIGLLVAGGAALAAEIIPNWNFVKEKVTEFLRDNMGLIIGVGIALVVLGLILICTGVGIPLGIGLLVAGGASLAAAIAPNWGFFKEKVKEMWEGVKSFWNKYIAPVFTTKFWLDLAKRCGNGLIGGFEAAINGIITMFENMINWVVKGLNKLSFDVPDWVPGIGGKKFGFNIKEVQFSRVSLPRLAQGAVLPGGKPYAAIVNDQPAGQTNIETPLQTMVEAFNMALNQRGNDVVREEHYYLNEKDLMRVIYKLAKGGETLKGKSLLNGGIA